MFGCCHSYENMTESKELFQQTESVCGTSHRLVNNIEEQLLASPENRIAEVSRSKFILNRKVYKCKPYVH